MNNKYLLVAIDGTNSIDWIREDVENSFVARFYRDFNMENSIKYYSNGPNTRGSDCIDIFNKAMNWIKSEITKDTKLILIGHSRGGYINIALSQKLSEFNIRVNLMALYDAVDRDISILGVTPYRIINCDMVYHAIRDPDVNSRWAFGNCGLYALLNKIEIKKFYTTHGGMGGDYIYDTRGIRIINDTESKCDIKNIPFYINANTVIERCKNESTLVDLWIRSRMDMHGLKFTSNSVLYNFKEREIVINYGESDYLKSNVR